MSDNIKNNGSDNEKFSFINEEIIPKRKKRGKKIVCIILCTIFLGIIFGLAGRIAFTFSEYLFDKPQEDDEHFVFPTEEPKPTEPADKQTARPKETEQPVVYEPLTITIEDYKALYRSVKEVEEKVSESIVTVASVEHGIDGFNNVSEQKNLTSGTIVRKTRYNIYILVAKSRIIDANNIRVTFISGETFDGVLHAYDETTDLAVIKVSTKEFSEMLLDRVKEVIFGESYLVYPGEPIIALGNPNGYIYSVDFGIVTNSNNFKYITDNRIDLFNTNICDNPNGDGIIVDLDGKVKGVITNKFKSGYNENINTVLSISRIKPIIQKLVNGTDSAYFGILGEDISMDISKSLNVPTGIYVNEVETSSPAFDAGIQNGDIITEVDETKIASMINLNSILVSHEVNDKLAVKVVRMVKTNMEEIIFNVELGKR